MTDNPPSDWRRAYYCREYGNFDSLHADLLAEIERLSDALGEAWDDGNGTGLDGWTGPGRGTLPIDDQAIRYRDRCLAKIRGGEPGGLTAEVEQLRAEVARLEAITDVVELADGRTVPAGAVHALDELDARWPGATLPQARPAVAAAVIDSITGHEEPR